MITRKFQANKKWRKSFVTPSTTRLFAKTVSALLLLLFSLPTLAETAFTYQGRLSQSGEPANGIYVMRFNLFDAVTAGSLIGPTVSESGVKVLDGVFNVMLDFGEAPFGSDPRWLRIEVKEAGGGAYVVLFPRQRVGASPFAIETLSVAAGAVDTAAIQNGAVTRSKLATDVVGTSQIENNTVTSSDIRDGTVAAVDLAPGLYRTKADLYEVKSSTINLLSSPQDISAFCNDENDLPLMGGCNALSNSVAIYVGSIAQYHNWVDSSAVSGVTCGAVNLHPSNPSVNPLPVQAQMVCISVP